MREDVSIHRLGIADLRAYKALRDEVLARHPQAFTSDAPTERARRLEEYLPRLGLDRTEGGHLLLGASAGPELIGAIGLERDLRVKVRHVGHVVGMMVREPAQRGGVGGALLDALVTAARSATGLELLTLTVTDGNAAAVRLYERAGFSRFGTLVNAVKVGEQYHAKIYMAMAL